MKRPILISLVVLGVVIAGWIAWQRGWLFGSRSTGSGGEDAAQSESGDSREVGKKRGPVTLGRLEPADKVFDVGALVGDRVASFEVVEGADVDKGDPLAILESRTIRRLELQSIKSQLAEAKARYAAEEDMAESRIETARLALKKVQSQVPDIESQRAKVKLLEANRLQAEHDAKRLGALGDDIVSPQERERQGLLVQQAAAEHEAAKVMLEKLIVGTRLAIEAAEADLAAAKSSKAQVLSAIPVKSLEAGCELAQTQLNRTIVTAPCKGTVLKIFARPGELLGNAPILQMADLSRMAVVAEVHENDVRRIKIGQTAQIASKAFPSPYDKKGLYGKVQRVGKMVSPPGLRSVDPFAPVERHVVEVRIELDKEDGPNAADFTHMQVDVTFLSPTKSP
jgi:HlyD family secretion protein